MGQHLGRTMSLPKHPLRWSPNHHYAYSGARIGVFRSGLVIEKPVSRAPSTESLWLDKGPNRTARAFTKWELCNDLATLALPSTLSALPNDLEPRPGSSTFVCAAFSLRASARLRAVHKDRSPRSCPRFARSSFSTHRLAALQKADCTRLAGRRASLGLTAYLGHGAKMLGSVSTTDVHVTSTRQRHHLKRLSAERQKENPSPFSVDRPSSGNTKVLPPLCPFARRRTTLRSSSLQQRACLTAHAQASARPTLGIALLRPIRGELRRLFSTSVALSIAASDTFGLIFQRIRRTAPPSNELISGSPAARQCRAQLRNRGAFHRGRMRWFPRGTFASHGPSWPAQTLAALVHRCSMTSTRPGNRAAFAVDSKPNALDTTSASRCLYEHDYGSPEHPTLSGDRLVGRPFWARPKVTFPPKTVTGFDRGQGSSQPRLDIPLCGRPQGGLRPNPDRFRAPRVAITSSFRCLERRRN